MTPPADPSTLSPSEKDALIAALLARVKALLEEVEGLRTENAALRDKLSLPPKTPRNSSKPPSQGTKANGETEPKPKSKPHAGAYRCGGVSSAASQPDAVPGGLGRLLSAVPGGCDGCRAGSAPHLRLDRDPRDHAGRHTGDALWRHLPVLSGPVQGGGPQCVPAGLALWAQPARLRALSALRSGDPVRAAGAVAL